ncbi:MraY family glycosyltransferase [Lacinutrix neustonica]|uniref:MraY family glycosyltransferase n=1 Tax=Lacinutrix neustonica TaxID=2980107 RepID=A0A9E8MTI5_9FLAO|nr:MraY family glycosyltransferase [Lacinutrix neustonica]WAC01148.1 MraY family glycosyltransferase [Lacinutrix neustonica]
MSFIDTAFSNLYFLGVLSATIAVVLSRKIFPAIIYLSNTKNLMDVPGERSMHTHKTATLGGVGVFITFSLTLILFGLIVKLTVTDFAQLISLLFGIIILLFLGIKDDLLVLSAQKKLVGQIIAASVVVILGEVRISSLGGLLGIGELAPIVSVIFTILTFVFIINAFNLADGIDGLAGSIAILSSTIFGIYFLVNSNYLMALVSFILIGSLISFLYFNLSKDHKIFMGDSVQCL